ncbi:hypothetical protein [Microvirga solisilvae]|uniref:hypothetical protein n=1 Tax=Microvirga solisilvae TaxID=2919498 RepID=UPI001FAF3B8A|nr:hypothetical protein [Microvirga solisilvae]
MPNYRSGGYGYRPYNRYYGNRYYRNRYYGGRYYGRGYYRPSYYGYRGYGYPYYGGGYYGGGAAVAGLIGGLALGTIASAAANPHYGYGPRCALESRRVINRYGRPVWRRVQVCY